MFEQAFERLSTVGFFTSPLMVGVLRRTTDQEVVNQQRSRAANLTPIDKLKEKATAAAMKKQYSVFDYYRHSKLQDTLEVS